MEPHLSKDDVKNQVHRTVLSQMRFTHVTYLRYHATKNGTIKFKDLPADSSIGHGSQGEVRMKDHYIPAQVAA